MERSIYLSKLCAQLNLNFEGRDSLIYGLGLCNREPDYPAIISYVSNETYVENVKNNPSIQCLLLSSSLRECYSEEKIGRKIAYVFTDKPEITFYQLHELVYEKELLYERYRFPTRIGEGCKISKSAVIEDGVIIGKHVSIGPNTVVRAGSVIDDNVTIGCNTTIGSEGFQVITDEGLPPMHITHVGKCHICSDVYIGDNTCICNSLFGGETYIGEGAKIDNLVHIAHNLFVGKNAAIAAHVIACGSSRIEEGAWIAPNASILNRVTIGKGAKVGLGSVVTRDVAPFTVVYGTPAKVH